MTSESARPFAGRVHSARKRSGGRRDTDALPASTSERIRVLGTTVQQLTAQLHEERVQTILDLRFAGGLVSQKERSESYDGLAKLPNEALDMLRGDLVNILARISNSLIQAEASATRGGVSYIG